MSAILIHKSQTARLKATCTADKHCIVRAVETMQQY